MALKERGPAIGARSTAFIAHPFEHAVAGLFLVSGTDMLIKIVRGLDFGFASLPTAIVVVWSLMILGAGAGMIASATRPLNEEFGRELERSALYLAIAAWSTLGGTILWLYQVNGIASAAQAVCIIAGCIGRLWGLRAVKRVIKIVREEAAE